MPTPPLPEFQNLLRSLHIPLHPTSLSSIPPTLLLLALERITHLRLPLSSSLRRPKTEIEELELVKVLMGVIGDDELKIDLSAVDPLKILRGEEVEMGVIIMSLVVIAKRHGVDVRLYRISSTGGEDEETEGRVDDEVSHAGKGVDYLDRLDGSFGQSDGHGYMEGSLAGPIKPDITLTSPLSSSPPAGLSPDVFGFTKAEGHAIGLFRRIVEPENGVEHRRTHLNGQKEDVESQYRRFEGLDKMGHVARTYENEEDGRARERKYQRDVMAFKKVSSWKRHDPYGSSINTQTTSSRSSGGHRTVLQEMMDEFGLG